MFPLMNLCLLDNIKFLLPKYQNKTKSLYHKCIFNTVVCTAFRHTTYSGKQKMNPEVVNEKALVATKIIHVCDFYHELEHFLNLNDHI